jgi:hypothetical protein
MAESLAMTQRMIGGVGTGELGEGGEDGGSEADDP